MSTRTREASRAAALGRFARPRAGTRRPPASPIRGIPRPPVRFGRRPPQKSTGGKAVERLTGLLPGTGTSTTSGLSRGGRKTAGFGALVGAATLAFKSRDKLTRLLSRDRSTPAGTSPATHPPTMAPGDEPPAPPATGVADARSKEETS